MQWCAGMGTVSVASGNAVQTRSEVAGDVDCGIMRDEVASLLAVEDSRGGLDVEYLGLAMRNGGVEWVLAMAHASSCGSASDVVGGSSWHGVSTERAGVVLTDKMRL